jgi:inositol-phosphate phosphatase/L-galactose 1-phosphate phosphatase/histidinol-phosphatase
VSAQPRVADDLVAFANRLADTSGAIARRYFRQPVGVEAKPDQSPVTIADREAEAAIRKLIAEHYPHHGVIGEEHGADRPDAEYVWVLDPIDGTKSFIAGRPTFGTLIALARAGVPVLGVIDHPALGAGERWVGAIGHPTLMNGAPVATRACAALADAALFASSPHYFTGDAKPAFDRVRRRARQVLYSADCYPYGLIASGFADLLVDAKMAIYDYLAGVPVVEGAGGVMTDWQGRPLTIASGDRLVAAGDRRLHDQVLAVLAAES